MNTTNAFPPTDWLAGVHVSVERAGQAILRKGRRELLEGIERCHSISAAARDLGISYRHAWLMIQAMNQAAGEPLVRAATGGQDGGGARLTDLGQWTVRVFREMEEHLQQCASGFLQQASKTRLPESIHVAAAVCLEEVLGQLLTEYGLRQPTIRIRAVFGGSDELADHVLAGSPVDLFVSAGPEPLNRLEAAGMVEPDARRVLAENSLAVIGPADRDLPIRNSADLARSHVERIAMADPATPLGRYTVEYLSRKGLHERLASRAVYVDNSRAVGAAVRGRSADVGLVYGSDARQASGCRLLFKARKGPSPIQLCGAVVRRRHCPEQAASLLSFLTSRAAARRFLDCGFLAPPKAAQPRSRD